MDMKYLILFLTLASTPPLLAQTLLVPHSTVNFEEYNIKCHTDGYLCTQDYFKQVLINEKSIVFEQFIESVDLYQEDYRKNLFAKVQMLISQEVLSLEQIALVIKIISKSETFEINNSLTQIKNELIDLHQDMQNLIEEKSDIESYLLFKRALSKRQYSAMKYKIRFSLVTKITPFTAPNNVLQSATPLITGFCETAEYNPILNRSPRYVPLFASECALSEALTTSKTNSQFNFNDYKKPLIYTAAGLLLISFFNQYKVDVTF